MRLFYYGRDKQIFWLTIVVALVAAGWLINLIAQVDFQTSSDTWWLIRILFIAVLVVCSLVIVFILKRNSEIRKRMSDKLTLYINEAEEAVPRLRADIVRQKRNDDSLVELLFYLIDCGLDLATFVLAPHKSDTAAVQGLRLALWRQWRALIKKVEKSMAASLQLEKELRWLLIQSGFGFWVGCGSSQDDPIQPQLIVSAVFAGKKINETLGSLIQQFGDCPITVVAMIADQNFYTVAGRQIPVKAVVLMPENKLYPQHSF